MLLLSVGTQDTAAFLTLSVHLTRDKELQEAGTLLVSPAPTPSAHPASVEWMDRRHDLCRHCSVMCECECVCVCVCVWWGEIEEEREGGMEGEPKFWAHSRPSISPF